MKIGASSRMQYADKPLAYELYLEGSNDGDLYQQQVEPTIKNFTRKMKKGTYDHDLALKQVAENIVPNVYAKYKKENGITLPLNSATKYETAKHWLPSIEEQAKEQVEQDYNLAEQEGRINDANKYRENLDKLK